MRSEKKCGVVPVGVTIARANAMYRYVTLIANEAVMRNFTKDDQGYHILMYYVGRLDPLGVRAFVLGAFIIVCLRASVSRMLLMRLHYASYTIVFLQISQVECFQNPWITERGF